MVTRQDDPVPRPGASETGRHAGTTSIQDLRKRGLQVESLIINSFLLCFIQGQGLIFDNFNKTAILLKHLD